MDKGTFEEKLLAHLEKESLILTPVNVGFAVELDATDAQKLMDELVADNKLELVSGSGTGAIYKRPGHATYETSPGEKSVGKSKSSAALYHLLLNAFFPGFGSLIYKRWALFASLTVILGIAVCMMIFFSTWAKLFSTLVIILWWVVAFLGGIYYYMKDPWSEK